MIDSFESFGRERGDGRKQRDIDAVRAADVDRVRELLNADPSSARAINDEGCTPLHLAAFGGHGDIARLLIEAGSDVNAPDTRWSATPAGWAIEYLRELGALLTTEIEDAKFAVQREDIDWVLRLLTRHPALLLAKDASGTPLSDYARQSGNAEIIKMFGPPR